MSAIEYPTFAPRASSARRIETIAVALGLLLPVPALAATGLSVPLPNVVERIAAALVPWAESPALEAGEMEKGASGSIVAAAGESSSVPVPAVPGRTSVLPTPTPAAATPRRGTGRRGTVASTPTATSAPGRPTVEARAAAPDLASPAPTAGPARPAAPQQEPGPEPSAPHVPGSAPAPAPGPAPAPTQTTQAGPLPVAPVVESTVESTVGTVGTVAADPVGTVEETVEDPVGTVTETVTGILPAPKKPLPGLGG